MLSQMKKYNFITASEYDSLSNKPIVLDFKKASHNEGLAPYLRELLRGELKKWCKNNYKADGSNYNLYTDGLKIYTTINSKMQLYAEEAVRSHISSLQEDFLIIGKVTLTRRFLKSLTRIKFKLLLNKV